MSCLRTRAILMAALASSLPLADCQTSRDQLSGGTPAYAANRAKIPANPRPEYSVVDLGVLPGCNFSSAMSVSDADAVIGFSSGPDRGWVFLWRHGKMTEYHLYEVSRISGSGIFAGSFKDGAIHLWRKGQDVILPYSSDEIGAVNDREQIVGSDFIISDRHLTRLACPPGNYAHARGVNNSGEVVGQLVNELSGLGRAVLWRHGECVLLDKSEGQRISQATAINDRGEAVGIIDYRPSMLLNGKEIPQAGGIKDYRPVLWRNGEEIHLEIPPHAVGSADDINQNGWVVGAVNRTAALWRNGHLVDLNKLIPPNAGWKLGAATGINARCDIIGDGDHHGLRRGFLLLRSGAH